MMRRHAIWCLSLVVWLAAGGCGDDEGSSTADPDATDSDTGVAPDADAGSDEDGAADVPPDLADADETGDDLDDTDSGVADGDADTDAGDEPIPAEDFEDIAHTPANPAVPPDGHEDVTAALGAGEVRAGMVANWEHGFAGIEVDCRPGDYKIYNSRVQFCIAGDVPINLFTYSGGQLVDADRVGASNDRFFMLTPQASFSVAGADTIEVVEDGRNGTAVIAVRGPEEPFRLISDLVGMILPRRGVSFVTEYRLAPDVDYLEIVTWLRPTIGPERISFGDLALLGDSSEVFYPGYGRDYPGEAQRYEFLASTAPGRSYALWREDGYENLSVDFSEVLEGDYNVIVGQNGLLPPGSEGGLRRYLIVGDGGTNDLRETIAEIAGTGTESGALLSAEQDGTAVAAAILVRDAEGQPRDLVHTGAEPVRLVLPPGSYAAEPENWPGGSVAAVPFTVTEGNDAAVVVDVPEPALLTLEIDAMDGPGGPQASPAKVRVSGPASALLFVHDGSFEHPLPPGTYRLEISRGEEFTVQIVEALALAAGDNPAVEVTLERVWATDGLIAGEFHQHMTSSPDSTVSDRDRLLGNLAEGVDFIVPTDHEAITNLTPLIDELGIGELIYAMPATEVSPLYGHLNPMPMPWDPALPAAGAYEKTEFDAEAWTVDRFAFPRIVSDLRDMDIPVIQVNHPRDGFALFDTGGWDPVAGPEAADPNRFSTDFDSVEVFNNRGEFCGIVDDWIGFIARGIRITGVGNSDTHSRSSPGSYPRNFLGSEASAGDMTDGDIVDALLAGDVSVSGGALITFPGVTLGSLVDVSGGNTYDLPVLVQTPVWSSVDELLVVVDGDVAAQIAIDEADEAVVVFDDDVELTLPDHDTYAFALAWGNDAMSVVYPGERPFGFTNPIYLDVDGDGEWTPPGISSADDLPDLQIPWCD